jgi:hypothetical protein
VIQASPSHVRLNFQDGQPLLSAKKVLSTTLMKLTRVHLKRLGLSVLLGLIPSLIGFLDAELNFGLRFDTFPGNLLVRLMWPGYILAKMLFPELAKNESAGILLLPAASLINIIVYALLLYSFLTLIAGRERARYR